ncbi:flagellar hook-length control protein FliK [Methylocapsa polymorpha]|uniref:Flagellar hook-length control protein FliK n=1 Tax=Methylocapsa polymorpha TaxID=3080828 RepID=A0ABZ0HRU8_9HYPH|nr:flagellar hook-length control protein FliK [Methylocapsa sp. RX1]
MNSVDGFAQNRPMLLDISGASGDSKAASSDGLHSDARATDAFADVLSNLSIRSGQTGGAASQASQSSSTMPGLVHQSFLFKTGSIGAAEQDAPTPTTTAPTTTNGASSFASAAGEGADAADGAPTGGANGELSVGAEAITTVAAIGGMLDESKTAAAQAVVFGQDLSVPPSAARQAARAQDGEAAPAPAPPGDPKLASDGDPLYPISAFDDARQEDGIAGTASPPSRSLADGSTTFSSPVSTRPGAFHEDSASGNGTSSPKATASAAAMAPSAAPVRSDSTLTSESTKPSGFGSETSNAASAKGDVSRKNSHAGPESSSSGPLPAGAAIFGGLPAALGTLVGAPRWGAAPAASTSLAATKELSTGAPPSASASFAPGASPVQFPPAPNVISATLPDFDDEIKATATTSEPLSAAKGSLLPSAAASRAISSTAGAAQQAAQVASLSQRAAPDPAMGRGANQEPDLLQTLNLPTSGATQTLEQEFAAQQASASSDPGANFSNAAPVKITILDQHTHYPPAAGLSPTQQIIDRIAADFSPTAISSSMTAAAQSNGAAGMAGAGGSQPATSSVKTLDLQLEPESLGRVTIQLRLSGARLELQVVAANPQTMRMIGDDKDLLVGRLHAAGYSVDALVVKAGDGPGATGQSGFGAGQGGSDQSAGQANSQASPQAPTPGASQYGERSANDRSSTQRDREQPQSSTSDDLPDSLGRRAAGGDLYV